MARFRDRAHGGQVLAERLAGVDLDRGLVLALPRGGVPVGREVAVRLGLELDVLVVRKLGVPGRPELAMGAVAPGGVRVVDTAIVESFGVGADELARVEILEAAELERREKKYRAGQPPLDVSGRSVVVVDDGVATGATMAAALRTVAAREPARLIAAAPVGSADAATSLAGIADDVVFVATPEPFVAVGVWYRWFDQVSDSEVVALLTLARQT